MHSAHPLGEVFPWNKSFETGIPQIDKQHQRLVSLLNLLAVRLSRDPQPKALDEVLDALADYAREHFETEEAVWNARFHGDEWEQEHLAAHAAFTTKVSELRERAVSGSLMGLYEHIVRFLAHWLSHHILGHDMRMARVVNAMEAGLDLEQAKERVGEEMSSASQVLVDTLLDMYGTLTTRTLEVMNERHDRIGTEEALAASEQRERAFGTSVISGLPALFFIYDGRYRLVRWNHRLVEDLGYSDDELRGRFVLDFFDESGRERMKSLLAALEVGKKIRIEEEVRRKDGTMVPYLLSGALLDLDGKQCFVGTGIEIPEGERTAREMAKESSGIHEALRGTVVALGKAIEARDPSSAGHQQRVATIALAIGDALGLDPIRREGLGLGAAIHDVGTLAIPAEILVGPSRLTAAEYSIVQTHPVAGAEILRDVHFPWPVLEIVSQHHERLDGSGYPRGLAGDEICLEARIVAVADVFEAMTAERPYRPALGTDAAMRELEGNRDTLYDGEVVDALRRLIDEDPERFPSPRTE